jgi:hypothetical protein
VRELRQQRASSWWPTDSSRRPGHTHADVLLKAGRLRLDRDDYSITHIHLADATEALVSGRAGRCRRPLPARTYS